MKKENKVECCQGGFIRLVDIMGNDTSIVQSARVSYGAGTKSVREDKKLLNYLWKHKHFSPFEQVTMKFHVRLPIFVARQWMRHRFSYNEYSMRYSEAIDGWWVPDEWRSQDNKNKQGSLGVIENQDEAFKVYDNACRVVDEAYHKLIELGVSREMARAPLGVNRWTEFYMTTNLRSLINFIQLRLDSHAQKEIQEYGQAMVEILKDYLPWTIEMVLSENE